MRPVFDENRHYKFIEILSETDYVPLYLRFCEKYSFIRDGSELPKMKVDALEDICRSMGIKAKLNKKYKVLDLDTEIIHGWTWRAPLVIQRYDMLEPMLDGNNGKISVGTTMMVFAKDAGKLRNPPIIITAPAPRPDFDGDMRTMERMIPDLVALFRTVKDTIRAHWPAIDAAFPDTAAPRTRVT
jgi:hypothetical protein